MARACWSTNPSLSSGQGSVVVWSAESGELLLDLSEPPQLSSEQFDEDAVPITSALWGKNGTIPGADGGQSAADLGGGDGRVAGGADAAGGGGSGALAEDASSLLLYNISDTFDEEANDEGANDARINPTGESALIVWDIAAARERLRLASPQTILGLDWSQPGQRLVTYDGQGGALLWDLSPQGELAPILPGAVETIDWSPDGTRYYAEGGPGEVAVIEAASDAVISRHTTDGLIMATAWHDSGEELLVAPLEGPLLLLDVETGDSDLSVPTDSLLLSAFFSEDSRLIAYNTIDGMAHLLQTATGEEQLTLPGVNALYTLFDEAGTRLLTPGLDGRVAVWAVADPARPVHEFQLDRPTGLALFVGPDQQQVLTISHVNYDIFGMAEGERQLQRRSHALRGAKRGGALVAGRAGAAALVAGAGGQALWL